jgi:hypothetical protein
MNTWMNEAASPGRYNASIAVERIARMIASAHGSKMIYRHPTQGMKTVAAMRGYDSGWAWEIDRYTEVHWPEYAQAAEQVIELLSGGTP